jgi:hypothetical protein
LDLNFSKHWFKHNILAGANIDDGYVNWDQVNFTDEKVFCVGDSFTYGHGVARNETWPSMLDGKICNFGSKGLSHDGCLRNVKYILQNSSSVKQIICLLPSPTRKLFEFDFLGHVCTIPIDIQSVDNKLPKEYAQDIKSIKDFIVSGNIEEEWIRTCKDIIELCSTNDVDCWLSTWDKSMHNHIPNKNKLPVFPSLDTFEERANDNSHPHRKHYELFVKNINPYIDKRQS